MPLGQVSYEEFDERTALLGAGRGSSAVRRRRRRRAPESACYSVYQEFEEIGAGARLVGSEHARQLSQRERRARQSRLLDKDHPLRDWEREALALVPQRDEGVGKGRPQ